VTVHAIDYRKLPKRYALQVQVKLMELPNQFEPPEEPFEFSTDDPMKQAAELMNRATRSIGSNAPAYPMYPQEPAGFAFHKSASVTVQGFDGLAKIIGQFEQLTQQIEAEQP
jgi:hypothetical protein